MVNHSLRFGEQVQAGRLLKRQRRGNIEYQFLAALDECRRPVHRLRQQRPGLSKFGNPPLFVDGIGCIATGNGNFQFQVRPLRNTKLVVANQPRRPGLQRQPVAGKWLFLGDLQQQQGRLVVAVAHQVHEGHESRRRESEFAEFKPFRRVPAEAGRLAGVARIDPVRVPARIGSELQTQGKGFAGSDAGRFRQQFDLRIVGLYRNCLRKRDAQNGAQDREPPSALSDLSCPQVRAAHDHWP